MATSEELIEIARINRRSVVITGTKQEIEVLVQVSQSTYNGKRVSVKIFAETLLTAHEAKN
jgi:hypothetical protein